MLLTVKYFRKKAPSYMFDTLLRMLQVPYMHVLGLKSYF